MPSLAEEAATGSLEAARVRDYFLCRLSALPIEAVSSLADGATADMLSVTIASERELFALGERLSDRLFAVVSAETDRSIRGDIIKLRRDVFNVRPIRPSLLAVTRHVPEDIQSDLREWLRLQGDRDASLLQARAMFDTESTVARRRFANAICASAFEKGLLFSSATLYAARERYRSAVLSGAALNGREQRVERGLLRYFTRTAMKATPFSTLCSVVRGRFAIPQTGGAVASIDLVGDPTVQRSYVRLNKHILTVLQTHLKEQPTIRTRLEVELNPTIREVDGKEVFLSALKGKEVFQRMPSTEITQLVRSVLVRERALAIGLLVDRIRAEPSLDADDDEVRALVEHLLGAGFLRFRFGISEQDADWDLPLRALLESFGNPESLEIADVLRKLRHGATEYESATASRRQKLLAELRELVDAGFAKAGIRGLRDSEAVIYEDATADAEVFAAGVDWQATITPELSELVHHARLLGWPRSEQATMRHFFDTTYGEREQSVPLLRFYEQYFRNHFSAHLERVAKAQRGVVSPDAPPYDIDNPFGLPFIRLLQDATRRATELLLRTWGEAPSAEELCVDPSMLRQTLEQVPVPPATCRSWSLFVQLVPGDSPTVLVPRGRMTPGYGKYFSRFLYMLPESFAATVLRDNDSLTPDKLTEISGDGHFNANLHPPLLSWELSYPTGESGRADRQVRCQDMDVIRDPADPHALCLVHRETGERIHPVDLGFLNPQMRPPLYQLLLRFCPQNSFSVGFPPASSMRMFKDVLPAGDAGSRVPKIVHWPRVRFGRGVILSRQQWLVPHELFPVKADAEDAFDYMLRVLRWRMEHGIPEEFYARVHPRYSPAPAAPALAKHENGDPDHPKRVESNPAKARPTEFWKPQYIDLRSPLLVGLFGKLTTGLASFDVTLEERFPTSACLPGGPAGHYTAEMILQVDTPSNRNNESVGFSTNGATVNA